MGRLEDMLEELTPASEGAGPLLQRDYWAVIDKSACSASAVATLVRERFPDFPPQELVVFTREDGADGPLQEGETLEIKIRGGIQTAVCVIHVDEHSVTLGTVRGHPEAGRITFGAYPNKRGDIVFHIRSRARSSSLFHFSGFLAAGEPMQTNTWTDFIDRVAHTVGEGIVGRIQAETREIDAEEADSALDAPTFIAQEE